MCTRKAFQNFCFIFKLFYTFCNIPLPFVFHFRFSVYASQPLHVFSRVMLPKSTSQTHFEGLPNLGFPNLKCVLKVYIRIFFTPNRRSEGSGLGFSIAKYDCFRGRRDFRTFLWSVKWRHPWTIREAGRGVATGIFGSQRANSRVMFKISRPKCILNCHNLDIRYSSAFRRVTFGIFSTKYILNGHVLDGDSCKYTWETKISNVKLKNVLKSRKFQACAFNNTLGSRKSQT